MNNPFLRNIQAQLYYLGIWAMIIFVRILLLHHSYLPPSTCQFFFDSLIFNFLQAGCILALWYPVRYYRDISLSIPLFVLFHFLLLLISFVIWIGIGYLLTDNILSHDSLYSLFFRETLPFRCLTGFLIHVIFILTYYLFLASYKIKEQKKTIEDAVNAQKKTVIEKITRISVKKNQAIFSIPVEQIQYIEANGDYVLIYTQEGRFLKDRTMKHWETYLPDNLFARIHRSFIVNITCISKIELYEKETYKVQLKNGNSLKTSASGYKLLRQKMQL
ncbi:LytTR family transcriptional regulator [Bacteroidia bacterium]|nr:LytTR family transcriptional regulator [Bacteroidia bacterium]